MADILGWVGEILGWIVFLGILYVVTSVASAVWEVATEMVDEAEEGPGGNPFTLSYTCEHCGNTIMHWTQDPLVTDVLQCPRCGGVLEDQQAAAAIAHEYFEEEEDEW